MEQKTNFHGGSCNESQELLELWGHQRATLVRQVSLLREVGRSSLSCHLQAGAPFSNSQFADKMTRLRVSANRLISELICQQNV